MNKIMQFSRLGLLCSLLMAASYGMAALKIGENAPDFSLKDSNGVTHTLKDYSNKTVILEWTNHECPYVVKHYDSENMQGLQKKYTKDGVVWLSIISSAEGKQGAVSDKEANKIMEKNGAKPTAVLMDKGGDVGKLFKAKVTPHMYIIEKGKLAYMGGIDSIASTDQSDIPKATNYITKAMGELSQGKPVSEAVTRPYGCSIKY